MTNGSLMKVKKGSILQYFWAALAIIGLENQIWSFWELPFYKGFTVFHQS